MKKFFKNCWNNTALRNFGNVLVSVVISVALTKSGLTVEQSQQIGTAAGAVVGGL